jgi:hypothetical protein
MLTDHLQPKFKLGRFHDLTIDRSIEEREFGLKQIDDTIALHFGHTCYAI